MVALPLLRAHQALNVSAAAAAGLAAGISLDMSAAALATASLSKWRLEIRDVAGDVALLKASREALLDEVSVVLT